MSLPLAWGRDSAGDTGESGLVAEVAVYMVAHGASAGQGVMLWAGEDGDSPTDACSQHPGQEVGVAQELSWQILLSPPLGTAL